jgi:hypothetical protein
MYVLVTWSMRLILLQSYPKSNIPKMKPIILKWTKKQNLFSVGLGSLPQKRCHRILRS